MNKRITRTLRGVWGHMPINAFFEKLRCAELVEKAQFLTWIYPGEASFELLLSEGVSPEQIDDAIRNEECGGEDPAPGVEAAFDALETLRVTYAEYLIADIEHDRAARSRDDPDEFVDELYSRMLDAEAATIDAANSLMSNKVYNLIYRGLRGLK